MLQKVVVLDECIKQAIQCSPDVPTSKKRQWKNVTEELSREVPGSTPKSAVSTKRMQIVLGIPKSQSVQDPQGEESSIDEWEYLEFILDSGATATVILPNFGKGCKIQPGDASWAGVTYEVANGEEILNVGEKLIPVVTAEGHVERTPRPGR